MKILEKYTPATLVLASAIMVITSHAMAVDLEKAHQTAIKNCMNWNGLSSEYCTCVQDRVRASLSDDSYSAMMQFAEAYQENRRADLAAMQVNTDLSTALEPVDGAVSAAEQACKG